MRVLTFESLFTYVRNSSNLFLYASVYVALVISVKFTARTVTIRMQRVAWSGLLDSNIDN